MADRAAKVHLVEMEISFMLTFLQLKVFGVYYESYNPKKYVFRWINFGMMSDFSNFYILEYPQKKFYSQKLCIKKEFSTIYLLHNIVLY